jgi:hypothetical protein
MWCQKCQADVAGIASSDNGRALCTTCGNEIARSAQPPSAPAPAIEFQPVQPHFELLPANQTGAEQPGGAPVESARSLRDPRELLARWAREDALNPLEFALPREPVLESRKLVSRFDTSHSMAAPRPAAFIESARASIALPPAAPGPELPPTPGHENNIVHQAHPPTPPHFLTGPISMADKSSKWVTLVGQIFAYLGVGGLTVGTSLVLMGYFGGPASYVTTGWLVTTAGQMMLFLGVITLVSGGMEQTTQEVARRIDTLGERLVRIEQAAERAETKRAA